MNRGIYIHFPFCEKKCNYCDFYSIASLSSKGDYVNALCQEISSFNGIEVDTVYFGGGTPSLMSADELERVMSALKRSFIVANDAEITLEANPASMGDKLGDFRKIGINRLSLGVQSFNDGELVALGRSHTSSQAIDTIKMARSAGFDNLSLDLMFAIPKQTLESFEYSLNTAISLDIEHISVYALSIEEKTVFGVRKKRGYDLELPSEEDEERMYFTACEKLTSAGYEHYEISNFAKRLVSRHNLKYWRAEEYIGIGAAAHSYFEGERYSTPSNVKSFLQGATKQDCYKNTKLDRAEEFVFLSLRLKDGLDMEKLKANYGIEANDEFINLASELSEQGLCSYKNGKLSLTEKGFFVSNTIIVKFLNTLKIFS